MTNFRIVLLIAFYNDKIKVNDIGRVCGTHRREVREHFSRNNIDKLGRITGVN
jgi:hypothetical protein